MTTALVPPPEAAPGVDILTDMGASLGDPRDLTQQQIPLVRAMFEARDGFGLWMFAREVCGCREVTAHLHLDICKFLSRWGELELAGSAPEYRPPGEGDTVLRSWRRLHLCIPRDCFKTTLATRALGLWVATLDPEATIGIFNEAQDKSKSWIGSIKQVMERSKMYQVLWPERLPPGVHFEDNRSLPRTWKWGDTGLLFPRDSMNVSELTFEPFGIGGASTGKHFTHKIYDDIIGEKSAESEAVMEDAIHFVDHGRALERPSDNGCELVNYTRWAYHDVYRHMLQKWPADYQVYHRSLLENPKTGEPDVVNGQSIFPERFTTQKCLEMYETDPFVFSSQRQCIPMAGRQTSFDVNWVRYGKIDPSEEEPVFWIDLANYDPSIVHADIDGEEAPNAIPLSWCDVAIILDPAPSKKSEKNAERRARNGIVVIAMDPWGRRFHLEGLPLREDPVTVLDNIVVLARKWKTLRVGIEEVNFSELYNPLWSQIMVTRYPDVQLEFLSCKPEGQNKDIRISSLQAPHREGFWYYNRALSGYTIQELTEYPHSETRDLIDAMAYTDKILGRMPTPDEITQSHNRRRRDDAGRDPHTHY